MNSCRWPDEQSNVRGVASTYDVDEDMSLMEQMNLLANQLQVLTLGIPWEIKN